MRRPAPDDESTRPLKFSINGDSDDDTPLTSTSSRPQNNASDTAPSLTHFRVSKFLFRIFPRFMVALFFVTLISALLPGGWRVALCATNLLPAPSLLPGENVTLVAHRGCEYPYPENTLHALRYGARELGFVELDVSLTSDGEVVIMHDPTLERVTNGSGLTCNNTLEYVKSLQILMPERDHLGRVRQARQCTEKNVAGQSVPCVYRVPTLDEVFDDLPKGTRYMIDVKKCYTPGIDANVATCSNCTLLLNGVVKAMQNNFVEAEHVTVTSTHPRVLDVFREGMPDGVEYSLSVNQYYSHYRKERFTDMFTGGNYSSAAMYVGLVAVRPDLVKALKEKKMAGTLKHFDVYAWTIRRDFDFRLARCAGVSKLVVAEPKEMRERPSWDMEEMITNE